MNLHLWKMSSKILIHGIFILAIVSNYHEKTKIRVEIQIKFHINTQSLTSPIHNHVWVMLAELKPF